MKSRLSIPLLVIVTLSTVSLMALGVKLTFDERKVLRGQYQELYSQHIDGLRLESKSLVLELEQALQAELAANFFRCDAAGSKTGVVVACTELGPNNELLAPPSTASRQSIEFHQRLRAAFPGPGSLAAAERSQSYQSFPGTGNESSKGSWLSYFSSDGARLIYLTTRGQQRVGLELDKAKIAAAIIGVLPFTDARDRSQRSARGALLDEQGRELYVWGNPLLRGPYEPFVAGQLVKPLPIFQVQYAVPRGTWDQTLVTPALFTVIPALVIVVATLAIVTTYFYREHNREVLDAAARVNFVNQVSHELKTPLTNIRLYAELLQHRFEDDPAAENHLGVIVSESHRLSRLISTILNFSLKEKKCLELHPQSARVGETLEQVLKQFAPSLAEVGIRSSLHVEDDPLVTADVDAINQILSNLIGNVEKYAKSGGYLSVAARQLGDVTNIEVEDRGPGLAEEMLEKIFEPFFRTSNALTDGISGTGIGLTIARELARLHGGEIKASRNPAGGLKFLVTLRTPPVRAALVQSTALGELA